MSLTYRTALVTGVSRRQGIGFAITRKLLDAGARVYAQGWSPHDDEMPWGADETSVAAALGANDAQLAHDDTDLAVPAAPGQLVDRAAARFGPLDTLIINHARSSDYDLGQLSADELDLCWAVNVRASLLLVQAFAAQHERAERSGRVVLFTSGQHLAPMSREIPYAATKGALQQMTLTLSDALVDRGITVNCINPGPTDTGWADEELTASVGRALPAGRWNSPDEAAAVVQLLLGEDAATITGNVIDAEAGFRRWAM